MRKDEFYNIIPRDDVKKLAENIRLPAFVYFKNIIKLKYNELIHCMPKDFLINYAFKANPNKDVLEYVKSLGMGADVGSIGELNLAEKTGFLPEKIEFTGPGKTDEELISAINFNISSINIESIHELNKICKICEEQKKTANVGIRINPLIKSTGAAIKMNKDSQFGIIEDDLEQAFAIIISKKELINFKGFHIHLGSQITKADGIVSTFQIILKKVYELSKSSAIKVKKINFGGGWGIDMFGNKPSLDLSKIRKGLSVLFQEKKYKTLFKNTKFIIEPGRFLLVECGLYLSKIIYKKSGYSKKYLIIDGGMHHHYAAAGGIGQVIRRNYVVDYLLKNEALVKMEKYTIAGSLCTPADILASDVEMSSNVDVGDTIVFFNSGGYALSASPVLFLSHPLPNEILV